MGAITICIQFWNWYPKLGEGLLQKYGSSFPWEGRPILPVLARQVIGCSWDRKARKGFLSWHILCDSNAFHNSSGTMQNWVSGLLKEVPFLGKEIMY